MTKPTHDLARKAVDRYIDGGSAQVLLFDYIAQAEATERELRELKAALPGEELANVLDILEAGLADGSAVFGSMVSTALRVGARVEPPDAARKLIDAARRALAAKKEP